jgi:hypothetical protein
METKITIKRIYRNEGKTRSGKPYLLTKLLGTDSNYYVTFSQDLKDAKEGQIAVLEFEPKSAGHNEIKKVLSLYDANPPLSPQQRQTKEDSGGRPTWSPADDAAIGIRVQARLKRAREMVDKEFPDAKGYSDYMNMVAEIAHQLFAESASQSIQQAKERNMQNIGKR